MLVLIRILTVVILVAVPPVTAQAKELASTAYLGPTTTISRNNQSTLAAAIRRANQHGGTIVINAEVTKGPMPVRPNDNTRIIDLRYEGGINVVRGNHPRLEGIWPQYSGLNTGLGRNLVISDVLPFDARVESWKGERKLSNPINKNRAQDSHEYSNSHNHYQNLLSEVWAFSPSVNAVALWGDSGAFFPGAKSWGGFLSARSWPVHWQQYVPPGTPSFEDKDFDSQLVGLEIDVLNGGLPHGSVSSTVGMPLSKTGVQIVGFGQRNTAAIELRSEDSDDGSKSADQRKGTWHYGLISYNALNSESTFLMSATPKAKTGLDLSMTEHSDAAIKIKSEGQRTGIKFNDSHGGEIYTKDGSLTLQVGDTGFALVTPGGREVLRIGRWGIPTWNGVNLAMAAMLFLLLNIWMAITLWRQQRQLRRFAAHLNAT